MESLISLEAYSGELSPGLCLRQNLHTNSLFIHMIYFRGLSRILGQKVCRYIYEVKILMYIKEDKYIFCFMRQVKINIFKSL